MIVTKRERGKSTESEESTESDVLLQIVGDLQAQFPALAREVIAEHVHRAYARMDSAPVQDYVPVLVQRQAPAVPGRDDQRRRCYERRERTPRLGLTAPRDVPAARSPVRTPTGTRLLSFRNRLHAPLPTGTLGLAIGTAVAVSSRAGWGSSQVTTGYGIVSLR